MKMGTAVSAVDSLIAALKKLESKEFLSMCGCKSQIGELLVIVPKLRALFLQAESHSEEQNSRMRELKDVIFEANRVLEDIIDVQLLKDRGGLFKKVRLYWVAYCVSHELRQIRNNLNVEFFGIFPDISCVLDIAPPRERRLETCSYVSASDIIGREDEQENIVGMLLDSSNLQCDPSFLSIVGIGGLGKTVLAQLVYNHPSVTTAFPFRMWAWIGDTFDIDEILRRILQSVTRRNHEGSTDREKVQIQLHEQLAGKKYLIVLDDVWIEKYDEWNRLVPFLVGGLQGSWILVTTRSKITATIVKGEMYELQALSKENSWRLFQRAVFRSDHLSKSLDDELVMIGRNIVNKCAGVPLSIRLIGSILDRQDRVEWKQFQERGLACNKSYESCIMPILKLSFDILESPLKSCFHYCALFPKDFEIEKEKLKSLWMAQGYIAPSYEHPSIEDVCEGYFSSLLDRDFFRDMKKDKYGQIVSCKIHDIIHDLCQHVAGKEMCVMETICSNLDKNVHHLSVRGEVDNYTLGKTHILSYLHFCGEGYQVGKVKMSYLESLVAKCLNLKALDLSGLIFERLPDSVSKLVQLRYLNISGNTEIEFLPKSITELHNLQTLMLRSCCTLRELPSDLGRLVDLRLLDIRSCFSLTCMPSSMSKLTCLHSLSDYIVGGEQSYSSPSQWFDGLNELKPLNNLRGCLNIQIRWPKHVKYTVKEDGEQDGLCLGNKEHLIAILFDFIHEEEDGRAGNEEAERLMEKLPPHRNLKFFELQKYHGLRMPGWVTLLPNLVELCLTDCRELEYLPCLRNLVFLKVLKLIKLAKLEWIGEDSPSADSSSTPTPHQLPSLEKIEMSNLPKLKGWRRGAGDDHHQFLNDGSNNSSSNKAQLQLLPSLSGLKSLFIWNCPEMACFPPCLKLEDLTLLNFNSKLQMILNLGVAVIPFASSSTWLPHPENTNALKKVTISNVSWLSSLPEEAFKFLESLDICGDKELGSLGEATNVFCCCSSSLRHLIIRKCCTLSSVAPGGLEHLMALEELEIRDCNSLRLSEEQQEGVECNINLMPRLSTLTLHGLPQLVSLPNWMQFLPALQSLEISFCNQLRSMPNWMANLQSLTHLTVSGCSKSLKKRCQQEDPPGKDRLYIQHIRNIHFQECFY
ncbi:putative disease resistance protein RGA3 [Chenopodium quinoa]|uniref:Uncharacterized protein n=1 Tax=Chenopodium quinoa TaxID=63459 RepID=A0A803KTD0_CHEQI|nr:putative disease resistance protein RGA3 [Chenopodium quinoa]